MGLVRRARPNGTPLRPFALSHCALFFTVILKQQVMRLILLGLVIDLERIEAFDPRINEKNIEM
jgi:hypothetical protein